MIKVLNISIVNQYNVDIFISKKDYILLEYFMTETATKCKLVEFINGCYYWVIGV